MTKAARKMSLKIRVGDATAIRDALMELGDILELAHTPAARKNRIYNLAAIMDQAVYEERHP